MSVAPSTPNNETIMRKFLAFPALALAFGLAACNDSSTSSSSSWTGDASLVGTWRNLSSDTDSYDIYQDTTIIKLASGGSLSYVNIERATLLTTKASTLDTFTGSGSWSTSGTKFYLTIDEQADTGTYSISGTTLTYTMPYDTVIFARQ
jgi:hypothetical protein